MLAEMAIYKLKNMTTIKLRFEALTQNKSWPMIFRNILPIFQQK